MLATQIHVGLFVVQCDIFVHEVVERWVQENHVFVAGEFSIGRNKVEDRSIFINQVDDDLCSRSVAAQVCDRQDSQICCGLTVVSRVRLVGTSTRDGEVFSCASEQTTAVIDVTNGEALKLRSHRVSPNHVWGIGSLHVVLDSRDGDLARTLVNGRRGVFHSDDLLNVCLVTTVISQCDGTDHGVASSAGGRHTDFSIHRNDGVVRHVEGDGHV